MMRFTLGAFVAATLLVLAGPARAEMVDNPQYLSWKQHNPGTAVVMEMTTSAMGQTMTMELTRKLIEIDESGATVESTMKMPQMPQQPPPQKEKILPQVPREQAEMTALPPGTKGEIKQLGNEKIEVAGKTYDCKVHEFTGEQQGQKISGKFWTTTEIPGLLAKMQATSAGAQGGGDVTMTVKSVEKK
jgi:hypothetical protein